MFNISMRKKAKLNVCYTPHKYSNSQIQYNDIVRIILKKITN